MHLTTEAIAFSDSYKHMECLCGMRLQSFLTNGCFVNITHPNHMQGYWITVFHCSIKRYNIIVQLDCKTTRSTKFLTHGRVFNFPVLP